MGHKQDWMGFGLIIVYKAESLQIYSTISMRGQAFQQFRTQIREKEIEIF